MPAPLMATAGYATLWEFAIAPARRADFEAHYGPEGTWARLFRRANGYLGSELLQDRSDPLRYLTIDRWESREAWQAFRRDHGAEYERLDREFEGLTMSEAPLGEYAPAGGVAT
jgi:heme-degrading monooxygenase HmoA